MYHADFDYEVVNDVVAIYDLDLGNNSVTNDIQCILEILKGGIENLAQKKVIYRDSMGIFDEVVINENATFMGFRSINETTLDKAITKLKMIYNLNDRVHALLH